MYICNERPMYISHIRVYGYGTPRHCSLNPPVRRRNLEYIKN